MIDSYEKYRQVAKYAGGYFEEQFLELIDRLELAEKERDDVARQLVQSEIGKRKISEERDAVTRRLSDLADENIALRAKVIYWKEQKEPGAAGWRAIAHRLRAKVEQMERQEPVAWMSSRNGFICKENKNPEYNVPLKRFDLGAKGA